MFYVFLYHLQVLLVRKQLHGIDTADVAVALTKIGAVMEAQVRHICSIYIYAYMYV